MTQRLGACCIGMRASVQIPETLFNSGWWSGPPGFPASEGGDGIPRATCLMRLAIGRVLSSFERPCLSEYGRRALEDDSRHQPLPIYTFRYACAPTHMPTHLKTCNYVDATHICEVGKNKVWKLMKTLQHQLLGPSGAQSIPEHTHMHTRTHYKELHSLNLLIRNFDANKWRKWWILESRREKTGTGGD